MQKSPRKQLAAILLLLSLELTGFYLWAYYTPGGPYLTDLNVSPDFSYEGIASKYAWHTPAIRPKGFLFEVQAMNYTPFMDEVVNRSVIKYGLGEITRYYGNGTAIGEWGYSFHHLTNGALDGSGRPHYGGYPTQPQDRAEALEVIHNYVMGLMEGAARPWYSFNGHYFYHHYAGEWGFDAIGSEIGENIHNYQMQVAFNRGAARQYQKPWFLDFSAWHSGGITDYSQTKPWGEASGPDRGHSLSLYRRSYFMSYMAGTGALVAEAGGVNFFMEEYDDEGCFIPSPLGLVGQEFYNYATRHPDPGIPYTPFGIMLDYYHGTFPGFGKKLAYNNFTYEDGDYMTYDLLNTFFPGAWSIKNEKGALTGSPYGDTCDIFLQNAPYEILSSYPVIIPTGNIKFSQAQIENLVAYVKAGGVLLLNRAYMSQFPKAFTGDNIFDPVNLRAYGSGALVLYGTAFQIKGLMEDLLAELATRFLPFKVSGDVEYMINRTPDSWVITVINNRGVTKEPENPPEINARAKETVKIEYTGDGTVTGVLNLLYDQAQASINESQKGVVEIEIEPGDLIILEFQI